MRGSRINPKLSAWAQVHGTFDFNRTPLGPPGCRVLAHDKPVIRTKWSPHGLDGWYVGPALDLYRCYNIWVWETRAERICDTVTLFPSKVTIPASSSTDIIMSSLHDIVYALKHPAPASALAPTTNTQVRALVTLTELLTSICQPSTKPTPAPTLRVAAPEPMPQSTNVPTPGLALDVAPAPELMPLPVPPTPSLRVPKVTFSPKATSLEPPDPSNVVAPLPTYAQIATPPTPLEHTPPAPPEPTYDHIDWPHRKTPPCQKSICRPPKPTQAPTTSQPCPQAPIQSNTPVFTTADYDMHFAAHSTALNPDTGCIAEYRALSKCSDGNLWAQSDVKEISSMFQGLGPESNMSTGTSTLSFIYKAQVPRHKKTTYILVVCADRPEKPNPRRVRWTAGGDRIFYPGNKNTKTADIATAKLMLNSVIITPNGRFMTIDLKYFYLYSDLPEYEYVRIPLHLIPPKNHRSLQFERQDRRGWPRPG
jgi:hypothetical protein